MLVHEGLLLGLCTCEIIINIFVNSITSINKKVLQTVLITKLFIISILEFLLYFTYNVAPNEEYYSCDIIMEKHL